MAADKAITEKHNALHYSCLQDAVKETGCAHVSRIKFKFSFYRMTVLGGSLILW